MSDFDMSSLMQSDILDMAINAQNIINYLFRRGVIAVNPVMYGHGGSILIKEELWKELFPNVKPDPLGFAEVMYDGVKVMTVFQMEIKYEEASN